MDTDRTVQVIHLDSMGSNFTEKSKISLFIIFKNKSVNQFTK